LISGANVLSQAVGRRTGIGLFVWCLTITGGLTISAIQSYMYIQKFLSNPSSTLFSVTRNETLVPPSITVCPEPRWNLTAEFLFWLLHNISRCDHLPEGSPKNNCSVRKLIQFLYDEGLPVEDTLSKLAYRPADIVSGCSIGRTGCVPNKPGTGDAKSLEYLDFS
jgi:hypothetical protein